MIGTPKQSMKMKKKLKNYGNVLHRKEASPLPDCSDKTVLALVTFFFKNKINKIRAAFQLDGNS